MPYSNGLLKEENGNEFMKLDVSRSNKRRVLQLGEHGTVDPA